MKQKTICVDFDDTIRSRYDDLPINNVAEIFSKLKQQGYHIIISSARINPKLWGDLIEFRIADIKKWLENHKIPYDEVVAYKPVADIYIDDKGYRFEGHWENTYNDIQKLLG